MAVGTIASEMLSGGRSLSRFSAASAANTALTASTDAVRARRLLSVTVKYSAAPTQTGATVTLNSGAGAAYDAVLNTGSANAETTVYVPDGVVIIATGDAIDVLAPAGGGVITSAVTIYTEDL